MDPATLTIPEKIAAVTRDYYRQADVLHPGATELAAWIAQFPTAEQAELSILRVCQAMELPAFRRYVLENRGLSLRAYLLTHLSLAEFTYWNKSSA